MHLININLENNQIKLSETQIHDLEIADRLIGIFNNVLDEDQIENTFIYDGENLNSTYGFGHKILETDINIALQNDEEMYLKHISDFFESRTIEYAVHTNLNRNTSTTEQTLETFYLYYKGLIGLNKPEYLSSEKYSGLINSLKN